MPLFILYFIIYYLKRKWSSYAMGTDLFGLHHAALNEALKKEVERLKVATGEMMNHSESFNLGMQQMPYNNNPSAYFPITQQQPGPAGHQNMQMPPFNHSQSSMPSNLHHPNSHTLSDIMQNGPVGQLQGLDISNKMPHLVKSEGPSLSASESSTTF